MTSPAPRGGGGRKILRIEYRASVKRLTLSPLPSSRTIIVRDGLFDGNNHSSRPRRAQVAILRVKRSSKIMPEQSLRARLWYLFCIYFMRGAPDDLRRQVQRDGREQGSVELETQTPRVRAGANVHVVRLLYELCRAT